jgi:hypothetical protein
LPAATPEGRDEWDTLTMATPPVTFTGVGVRLVAGREQLEKKLEASALDSPVIDIGERNPGERAT